MYNVALRALHSGRRGRRRTQQFNTAIDPEEAARMAAAASTAYTAVAATPPSRKPPNVLLDPENGPFSGA